MDGGEFGQVAASFAAFHGEFAPLFGRKEAQRRSEQYLRGLLVQQTDRRNAENVAEMIEEATPRALQRLLTEAPWATGPVIDRLQALVGGRLNTPEGVFVLDESGFPKQGKHSVGVARQYCGTLGKVGNCQLGVFLAYASARGHALVDLRLFLPQAWTADPTRCRAAGVPEGVGYQSKAELGLAMLRRARAAGHLTGHWVAGDDAYGMVPTLRDALDAEDWRYVLDVPKTTPVFSTLAATVVPPWSGRGHRPTRPRLAPAAPAPQTVEALAASLPPAAWQALTVAEGAQGPRTYLFVARRVWESRDGLPGRACWLLLRRNLDGSEPRYYLSNAPADTPLLTLAQVAAARWIIETEFQTAKGETGLDEYEVRSWQGWHHHLTLALLAGAFLLTLQQDWGGKHAPDHPHASQPRAAGAAPAADLDRRRPARLAPRHPDAQRARQTLPSHTASPQAA
ncbi:MAG TPA: IS701 family transposase [Bacillota bacterium]|nr:IS701 family transposase [Bacillota bacterium]